MRNLKFWISSILLVVSSLAKAENPLEITVYRSQSCSCCGKWLQHLQKNQFNVKSVISDDMQAVKEKYGVPDKLASCHTAIVDGYVVEGHVPAEDIKRMLSAKPAISGIAAPGMPLGSPGMETDDGLAQDYNVLSFDKNDNKQVFSKHSAAN